MLSYGEKLLRSFIKRCFPGEDQLFNFRGTGIINPDTQMPLEIDIYLPNIKVGFEFHGRQHKTDQYQRYKDKEKRKQAKALGIELFEIWTATLEQDLYELIRERLPKTIKVTKPKTTFRIQFLERVKEYKKNIYSMNKTLKSSSFVRRRKK